VLYTILTECGLDMRNRLGLTHWVPAYPRRLFEKEVTKGEVNSVEEHGSGKTVATFTASRKAPPYLDLSLWDMGGEPSLYLTRLAVLPHLQRRGIGRECVATVERFALDLDCRSIRLDVTERHEELLDWYLHLGYREVGRYKAFGSRMVGFEKLVSGQAS